VSPRHAQLAEAVSTWRRFFAMGRGLVVSGLVLAVILRISDAEVLKVIALALIVSDAFNELVYMAGATTTDVIRLLGELKRPTGAPAAKEA
jgi:hypothetical protein